MRVRRDPDIIDTYIYPSSELLRLGLNPIAPKRLPNTIQIHSPHPLRRPNLAQLPRTPHVPKHPVVLQCRQPAKHAKIPPRSLLRQLGHEERRREAQGAYDDEGDGERERVDVGRGEVDVFICVCDYWGRADEEGEEIGCV